MIYCICILAMVLALASCQPTPDKVPVAQKADIEQAIVEQATQEEITGESESKYEYDEFWKETYKSDAVNMSIEANVKVEVPDVDAFPVVRVFRGEYDRTKIMEMIKYFAADATFSFEPIQRTKDELTDLMVEVARGQLIDGEYVVSEETLQLVEDLKKQIAEAPEIIETEYVELDEIEDLEAFSLNVKQKNGDDAFVLIEEERKGHILPRFLYAAESSIMQTESFIQSLTMDEMEDFWLPIELVADIKQSGVKEIGDVEIPVEDAQAIAQDLLNQFQIEDRPLAYTDKVCFCDENRHLIGKGYQFVFMPQLGGINGIYVHNGTSVHEPAYAAPFALEEIRIVVDEDGKIQYFIWENICKMGDTLTENIEIMSFEDMQETIIKQLEYNYLYSFANLPDNVKDIEYEIIINIDELKLGCCLTSVKDNPDEALLIPAWSVSVEGFIKSYSTDPQSGEKSENEQLIKEQMVFGSVDGLIIDLKGY